MGRRFVDQRTITARMDAKDDRIQRQADRLQALTAAARDLEAVAVRVETLCLPSYGSGAKEVAPVVLEVAIVPTSADTSGPVIDVALVPKKKTRVELLRTLADLHAVPRSIPKPHTKLERAVAHKAARLLDAKLLRQWAKDVKDRDHWKDRKTGRRVTSTRSLDADRAEAHHLEPKSNPATRYDVRNGLCLSFATHDAVETGRLRIVGTVYFTKGGVRYIDGTYAVRFEPT